MLQKRNFQEKLQMTASIEWTNRSFHHNDKAGIYNRLKLALTGMCILGYLIFVIYLKIPEFAFILRKPLFYHSDKNSL